MSSAKITLSKSLYQSTSAFSPDICVKFTYTLVNEVTDVKARIKLGSIMKKMPETTLISGATTSEHGKAQAIIEYLLILMAIVGAILAVQNSIKNAAENTENQSINLLLNSTSARVKF